MTDLHERLRTAVTKVKEIAEAATPGPWHWSRQKIAAGETKPQDYAHIVANDPTTVLRRCHRDLVTLDRHARDELGNCFWCSEDGPTPIDIKYPCPEIRLLAEEHQVEVAHDHP